MVSQTQLIDLFCLHYTKALLCFNKIIYFIIHKIRTSYIQTCVSWDPTDWVTTIDCSADSIKKHRLDVNGQLTNGQWLTQKIGNPKFIIPKECQGYNQGYDNLSPFGIFNIGNLPDHFMNIFQKKKHFFHYL